jgi:hypothetical protein
MRTVSRRCAFFVRRRRWRGRSEDEHAIERVDLTDFAEPRDGLDLAVRRVLG